MPWNDPGIINRQGPQYYTEPDRTRGYDELAPAPRPLGSGLLDLLASLVGADKLAGGQYQGRPQSAPGPLQDIIPGMAGWINPPAKAGLALGALAAPTKILSGGPGKTAWVKYWPKGQEEPLWNQAKSYIEFVEPTKRSPAQWRNIESGESGRGTGEMMKAFMDYMGPDKLNKMKMTNVLPGAVPFWESITRRLEGLPDLAQLRQNILDKIMQTKNRYSEANIPKNSYGYSRKNNWSILEEPLLDTRPELGPFDLLFPENENFFRRP